MTQAPAPAPEKEIILTVAEYMQYMGYDKQEPEPPQYNTRMSYKEWLIEDFQHWYYHDFGHPEKFKLKHVRILECEYDLKQKAKKLKRRRADGLGEVLQIPLHTKPHKMHANHNPHGW